MRGDGHRATQIGVQQLKGLAGDCGGGVER